MVVKPSKLSLVPVETRPGTFLRIKCCWIEAYDAAGLKMIYVLTFTFPKAAIF